MASEEFGLMKLLEKLIGERGQGAISDRETKMLSDAGSKMFIDQDEGWLAKPRQHRDRAGYGGTGSRERADDRFGAQYNWGADQSGGINNPFTDAYQGYYGGRGAMSDNELQNFRIASQYVDDGALSGWLTHKMPMLDSMGVGNFDMNLPPNELRNIIEAITAPRTGAMSDRERAMLQGMAKGMATGGTLGNLGL